MKHIIVSFALVAALSLSGTTQMAFASSMENQVIYDFQDSDVEEAGEEAGNKGEAVGKAAGEMPEEGLTSEPAAEAAAEEAADVGLTNEGAADVGLTNEGAASEENADEVANEGLTSGDGVAEEAAEETVDVGLTNEEAASDEVADEGLTNEETASEEAAAGEATGEETADEGLTNEEAASEGNADQVADEGVTNEDAASGEAVDGEVTGEEAADEEAEAAVNDMTAGEAAVAGAADSDTGAEDKSAEELPDNGIPVVIFEIDESEGHTIDDMNSSSDHSVECYGTMQIIVPPGFMYCDMAKAPSSLGPVQLDYIRGRGNSTWTFEKKPYKIKLNKKENVLGLGKNKHWVLLANTLDSTGFKNRFTGVLGDALGFEFTPNGLPVDVVMVAKKDGEEYARINLGNYLLAEQVRVGDNRLEIRELSADDTDPGNITGGYLIHFGSQVAEDDPDKFYTDRGINLANDTPTFNPDDSDYTNEVQKEYIRDYIQKMENALFGEGVNDGDPFADQNGIRYNEYMDMESAALFWLIQEVSNNGDKYETGSNYFYKTEDKFDDSGSLSEAGRIFWGPLWDMDQAWSLPGMSDMSVEGFHLINEWLAAMVYDDNEEGFRETAKRLWPTVRDEILTLLEDRGLIDQYFAETERSCVSDYEIWQDTIPDYHLGGDFAENKEVFKSWTKARIEWMDAHILGEGGDEYPNIDNAACRVTYVADEQIIRREYYQKGWFCTLYSPDGDNEDVFIPQKEGYVFRGWVDEDGSIAASEQEIDTDRTFYAVFDKENESTEEAAITYILDGGSYNGSTEDIVESYKIGDVISIHEAPSREGYTFSYWMGSEYYPGESYQVTGDHTFTAVWTKNAADDGDNEPTADGDDTSFDGDDSKSNESGGSPTSGDDGDATPADGDSDKSDKSDESGSSPVSRNDGDKTTADESGDKNDEAGSRPVSGDDGDKVAADGDGDKSDGSGKSSVTSVNDSKKTTEKNYILSTKNYVSSDKEIAKSADSSKGPSTGDESHAAEWLALTLAAGAAVLLAVLLGRKGKRTGGD